MARQRKYASRVRRRRPRTRTWFATALAVIVAGAALGSACFSDRNGTGPGATADCRVEGGIPFTDSLHYVVLIRDFAYHPAELRVPAGATVTWVSCEEETFAHELHTTTSDDGLWDSGLLPVGQPFSRRFGDAGEFGYHCTPHPFMEGSIAVE
jgi:plastocyanin